MISLYGTLRSWIFPQLAHVSKRVWPYLPLPMSFSTYLKNRLPHKNQDFTVFSSYAFIVTNDGLEKARVGDSALALMPNTSFS